MSALSTFKTKGYSSMWLGVGLRSWRGSVLFMDKLFPLKESLFSFAVALALLILLPKTSFITYFIVAGHAHFTLAFLYQGKAGKLTPSFLIALLFFSVGIAAIISSTEITWQLAVSGSMFFVHHFYDECKLLGFTVSGRRFVELSSPIFLFAAAYLIRIFGHSIYTTALEVSAMVSLMAVLFLFLIKKDTYRADAFTLYTVACSLPLVLLLIYTDIFAPGVIIGVLIYYHYLKWYFYSYRRMPHVTSIRRGYVRDVIIVNGIFITLYTASLLFIKITVLAFIFAPAMFYFMTTLHIFSSFMQLGFRRRTTYVPAIK